MPYSGASTARQARENLARALAALQEDPNIPSDVLAVAQNIAGAVGALFEAERASSEQDGKSSVKSALGSVSQTLALLQEVRSDHPGVATATQAIAQTLSLLFPLSTQPSRLPPAAQQSSSQPGGTVALPQNPAPRLSSPAAQQIPAHHYRDHQTRTHLEVNIGATTESNFYVGFSGEIREGGVFAATYNILAQGTPVRVLVTLPGGFEKEVNGHVRFVRDPMDMSSEAEPGMGIQFENLDDEGRELILRFVRKRAPMFYDE